MAPNKRGGPLSGAAAAAALAPASVVSAEEVAARGSGTREDRDSYDPQQLLASEARVWWTAWMFLTRLPGAFHFTHRKRIALLVLMGACAFHLPLYFLACCACAAPSWVDHHPAYLMRSMQVCAACTYAPRAYRW